MTHIPHIHDIHVVQNTQSESGTHTHTYSGSNTTHDTFGTHNATSILDWGGTTSTENTGHTHPIIYDINTGSTDPLGGHNHTYYVPYLRTDDTPITSMDFSMNYGNGHLPNVPVSNATATTLTPVLPNLLTHSYASFSNIQSQFYNWWTTAIRSRKPCNNCQVTAKRTG